MSQSAIPTIPFPPTASLPLEASFDAGHLTSDGGLLWLAEADDVLGLCAALAAQIPAWRRGSVQHSLETLVRQRVFQIACGYEDQDDADSLRTDPLLKLVCGRLPDGADLASQPTLSRLENAVDWKACYRLAQALLALYVQERGRQGVPERHPEGTRLDADSTDDPTHGDQEGSAYHGSYRQHQYHPLLLSDGDTDQLLCAVLRSGTAHASHGIVAILTRVVQASRQRWPQVPLEVRGDSGFAIPELDDYLEAEQITSTSGSLPNPTASVGSFWG